MFDSDGYQIVRGAIAKETALLAAIQFEMLHQNARILGKSDYDDGQANSAFHWYAPHCFEAISLLILPEMQRVTGKTLLPTYTFGRIYYNGSELPPHIDRPSCQYSATMTIELEDKWPIYMENYAGEVAPVDLDAGDMVVYRGDKLRHWRERFTGERQIQAFFHYVDAEGEYADLRFDRRQMLGLARVEDDVV
jgi:hypothetical protein